MPVRRHKSVPGQLDLLADRSKQFELMEAFEFLRISSQIAMLCRIFIAVGKYNRKVIPLSTLARRCGVGMKSAYRIKSQLEEMGLIFAKAIGGRSFEWSIGWANVWDLHEEWKRSPAAEEAEMDETDEREIVVASLTHETPSLTHETPSLTHETCIKSIELTSFKTSSSSTTSADDGEDDATVEALAIRLMDCGVTHTGKAIDTARERGMTFEQIHAVIDHYTDQVNEGRWSPNVLVDRLTREHMRLAKPDQGWFGENPEWTAAQKRKTQISQAKFVHQRLVEDTQRKAEPSPEADEAAELETKYGPVLDAMNAEERQTLQATFSPFMQTCISRFGAGAHKSHYRRVYLDALKLRANP